MTVQSSDPRKVFQGIRFSVYQWRQKMFDGSYATFEKIKRLDSVGIIAITADKQILIGEQSQPHRDQPFIDLLGGVIDPGEDWRSAGERELREEAGAVSSHWELWFTHQAFSSIEWKDYFVIARNCRLEEDQQLDAGELITIKQVSFGDWIQLIMADSWRTQPLKTKILEELVRDPTLTELRNLLLG